MSTNKTVFVAVNGSRRETAKALLDAADKAKVPQAEVRSTLEGYEVPEAVAAEYEKAQKPTARKANTDKE